MRKLELIERVTERILLGNPGPVVRFRLLRDIVKVPSDADSLIRARQEMLKSRWVSEL